MKQLLIIIMACYAHSTTPLWAADIQELFQQAYTATVMGDTTTAITAYNAILALHPDNAQIRYNLGYALKMRGDLDNAIKEYQHAITLKPEWAAAQFGQAVTQLYQGNLRDGWEIYCKEHLKSGNMNANQLKQWTIKHELQGKRLLLQHQGGLGDTMMFIRYVEELKKRGAYTIVLVPAVLKPLLNNCSYIDKIVVVGDPIPAHDSHITLMGLPLLFPEYENTVPTNIPYLFATPGLVELWKNYFDTHSNPDHLKIGLCWIADLKNDESRPPVAHRSISLEQLQQLSTFTNLEFYSLQKDNSTTISAPYIKTFTPSFDNEQGAFMDTAAVMQHLDLVITVDTSVAHLAGALGVPVFLLLPYSVDWRWTAHCTDSIWYPTMRIFKQQTPMNWEPVVMDLLNALHEFTNSPPHKKIGISHNNSSSL